MEKVLFWYGNEMKELDKAELAYFLSEISFKNTSRHIRYPRGLNEAFTNAYNFILKYLQITTCIQIYQDRVIRLHLKQGAFEPRESVFLNNREICNEQLTLELIESLRTFSGQN